jgi:hypothetical protein
MIERKLSGGIKLDNTITRNKVSFVLASTFGMTLLPHYSMYATIDNIRAIFDKI